MGWSWRVARIAGIDLYVHFTFPILLAWVAWRHYLTRNSAADALLGVAFIVTLFGIVVLHELGHALAARRYGIGTRDITLLPIGGVARLERMPENPAQELVVALAGPAVNVALAALLFVVIQLGGRLSSPSGVLPLGGDFLHQLLWLNIVLAAFNMLPAFPMDGGRVLRAVLAMRMEYVQATQVAARIGQGMAFVFGLLGLLYMDPFIVFIAFFVWLGAAQEAAMVQMRSVLPNIPVRTAMITDYRALKTMDTLARAMELLLAGCQQDFPVLEDDGRVAGVLTRADMLSALAKYGQQALIADVMQKQFETADPAEMLDAAFDRLKKAECCNTMPVLHNGNLVGLVTMENLSELLLLRQALRERQSVSA